METSSHICIARSISERWSKCASCNALPTVKKFERKRIEIRRRDIVAPMRTFLFACLLTLGATSLYAQPETRDHRRAPPHEAPPPAPPPPAAAGPTEAPPSPREEKVAARAGFEWITGKWEWRGKWEWVAGHWER